MIYNDSSPCYTCKFGREIFHDLSNTYRFRCMKRSACNIATYPKGAVWEPLMPNQECRKYVCDRH